jgi:hypothetical protein
LPEGYQWLIVPVQANPQASIEWQAFRLNGQDALAARASKKLKNDELLVTGFAASRLKMDWTKCGQHVAMKQLVEDFARYVYLPRLRQTGVLLEAVREGLRLPLGILRLSIVRLDGTGRNGQNLRCRPRRKAHPRRRRPRILDDDDQIGVKCEVARPRSRLEGPARVAE